MEVTEKIILDNLTQRNINLWLEGQYDETTKAEIRRLLIEDPQHLIDAFFTNLTFGTGGLRGIMGVGTNRMNFYTVRAATQGLANYINKQSHPSKNKSVFIGYDSRHQSKQFAEETAKVLAGNGIQTYLFKDIRPTPLVSFACRYKKCSAAIMITASHNPPEYNGYKVYWSDGGQLVSPQDEGVITEVAKILDPSQVQICDSLDHAMIEEIDSEIDEIYLKTIFSLQNYPTVNQQKGDQLKIVYTSLHGVGITMTPKALHTWGFTHYNFVKSQVLPDGNFPTVRFPNPEEPAALKLGIELMLQSKSDLLIANDPDADRMGIAVLHKGEAILLNGNQTCALLLEHVCESLSKHNKLPKNAAFIKTIGTTELFQAICDSFQRPCFNVLTGFKYIAEKIHEWELANNKYQFIFGGEESYGYLLGTHARDKDAVICSCLVAELALKAKLEGKTLVDKLHDLYHKYGIYQEKLLSINFGETKEGKEQMSLGMQKLRATHLTEICGIPVVMIEDYLTSKKFHLKLGQVELLTLPTSDVLLYWLEDGTKVMVRPSGTEPKVKIYCGLVEKTFATIEEGIEQAKVRCDQFLGFIKTHLMS